ncbi:hypothetical protein HYN56_16530 [Flavobacterium crocinum]|uniref:Uncharacterized protein n=1 Tax=Flavobacterium crocinum TaxID=2183896 RepID=A0A2S1YNU4_9FLAO|nr:hypothetical protein [Flavobacterium crocinum]AWK05755.1 hypothetical protein HYN56_16530 [Flavobacterium crocinum]
MDRAIQLQIRKELDGRQQQNIIKLKGSLISRGYTDIIHILDKDEEFHINFFETSADKRGEVQEYINAFLNKENLLDAAAVVSSR